MPRLSRVTRDRLYDEKEAAAALGITVSRLHEILDQHIFTEGNKRPQGLRFTSSDLLLLGYWSNAEHTAMHDVITMPKRN